MRRPLWKGCLTILVAAALFLGWILGARSLSLLLDQIYTVPIDSIPVRGLGLEEIDSGRLRINNLPMDLAGTDDRPFPAELKIDSGRQFVVKAAKRAITLGRVDESFLLRPAPNDRVRFQTDRGLSSWPTPFEINFMSGNSPSWKRHLYYRLLWEKPDRSRLEMVWRYEQYFYDRWANGFMTRAGSTGLIRVDIRP
jgi:hypothetical protein